MENQPRDFTPSGLISQFAFPRGCEALHHEAVKLSQIFHNIPLAVKLFTWLKQVLLRSPEPTQGRQGNCIESTPIFLQDYALCDRTSWAAIQDPGRHSGQNPQADCSQAEKALGFGVS